MGGLGQRHRRIGGTSARPAAPLTDTTTIAAACLLGGALGDALGAPVEFSSLTDIRDRFGPAGITSFAPAYGRVGAITDDTQMTLFTAEGLLRARRQGTDPVREVHSAYLRWLATQGPGAPPVRTVDDWLIAIPGMWTQRAPGVTCLSALRSHRMGGLDEPINHSKGCGAVMRAAPCGLLRLGPHAAFVLGCEVGAITHGHATGWMAAGALAAMVDVLATGAHLAQAVDEAVVLLERHPEGRECVEALLAARALAAQGVPDPEAVETLGAGWTGEEALAIGVAAALTATDVVSGLAVAVNHSGDSDSTGAICGNLLGAHLGGEALPAEWLAQLELAGEIRRLGDALAVA